MKCTLLILILSISTAWSIGTYSQSARISINMTDATIKDILSEIEQNSEFYFLYSDKLINVEKKVSISSRNKPVSEILASLFEGDGVQYMVYNRQIILTPSSLSGSANEVQQQNTVTGKVTGDDGNPLPGVNIVIKGTVLGTITDADGRYSIEIPGPNVALVFSFIGYTTKEINVGGRNVIDIVMEQAEDMLDEIITIGYMTQKKADLTGSVSVLSRDDYIATHHSNLLQSIQGRVPGMVLAQSGNPTGNVTVTIRGQSSMTAGTPLIVIDGLPTEMNLRDINTQDIASIQVLKDAASASIYGARAANGVILIETLKGQTGVTRVSYSGKFGISQHFNLPEMMNTRQYGEMLFWSSVNDGLDPATTSPLYNFQWHVDSEGRPILDSVEPIEWLNETTQMKAADTDWIAEGHQLGIQQDHQLTFTNGSENARQMFSINYFDNQGTQIYTSLRRITMRLNTEYDLLKGRLHVGENLAVSKLKIRDQNEERNFMVIPPIVPVRTEDDKMWGGVEMTLNMDDFRNPVRHLYQRRNNYNHRTKLLGNVFASVDILKGLYFKTLFGVNYTHDFYRTINPRYREAGGKETYVNDVQASQAYNYYLTWSNTMNYNLSLGRHRLDAVAGIENDEYWYEELYGFRQDLLLESRDYGIINAATGTKDVTGTANEWKLLSFFGKVNYVFDDKYLLSFTLRRDGSSKFGKNNRFGNFPAVSAGWRLSKESFLASYDFISDLKVRASWGMNGNSNIPTNAIMDVFDANYAATCYPVSGQESGQLASGYRIVHRGNPNLKWEATQQTNIGVDFGFFNQRIAGSVDYFRKFTDGMLYEPSVLGVQGEGARQWINAANMTNTGLELVLNFNSSPGRAFTYSIEGNVCFHMKKNVVNDLPASVIYSYGGNGLNDNILDRPLNSIYGFIADGLFKTEEEVINAPEQPGKGVGRIRWKDLDGDGQINWSFDRTWIGERDPDVSYGLSFSGLYKNFDFSMLWQGVAGNQIYGGWEMLSDFVNVIVQKFPNHTTRLLDAWNPYNNPDSEIPAMSTTNTNDESRISTYTISSASYLKLRNIEVGYRIPRQILRNMDVHLSVSAQNLLNVFKWWGDDAWIEGDPETPSTDTYTFGYTPPRVFLFNIEISY